MALPPVQNAAMNDPLWNRVFAGALDNLKTSLKSFDSNRKSRASKPIGFESRIRRLAERQLLRGQKLPEDSKVERLFRNVFKVEFLKAIESRMIEVKERLLAFDFYDEPSSTVYLQQYKVKQAQEAVSMETVDGYEMVNYAGLGFKHQFRMLEAWKGDLDSLIDERVTDWVLKSFKSYSMNNIGFAVEKSLSK